MPKLFQSIALSESFVIKPSLQLLLEALDSVSCKTFKSLLFVLKAPIDAPSFFTVIQVALRAIEGYSATLCAPSDLFNSISSSVIKLVEDARNSSATWNVSSALDEPMQRRLMRNSAWGLFLGLENRELPEEILAAIGAELAYSYAIGKQFPNGFATNLRRSLNPSSEFLRPRPADEYATWLPHFRKVIREARNIFESVQPSDIASGIIPFEKKAELELRGRSLFPSTKHRQAVLDLKSQSPSSIMLSSSCLRTQVNNGQDDALLTTLAFCSGLPLETTLRIPFSDSAPTDWVLIVDVQQGVIKTNLDPVFPKSASPKAGSNCNREANRVIVKPLPQFIADELKKRKTYHPDASCFGDLLPDVTASGRNLTIPDSDSGIAPTRARFLRSAAGFAVMQGIDRLSAAVISNDYGIIPSSKLYYCGIERKEIWSASTILFDALGWGEPTELISGLAFGSRVVPRPEKISEWHSWMRSQVIEALPGKRSGLTALFCHHTIFAMFCASFSIFCLASREVKTIKYSAKDFSPGNLHLLTFDKRCGVFPRPLPIPITPVLSKQVQFWFSHCRAFDRRLEHHGFEATHPLRLHLSAVASRADVPLFFTIHSNFKPKSICSNDLVKWWPSDLGFNPDFGRHFFEVELRDAGLSSSEIDVFLRHQVMGIEAHKSTTDVALVQTLTSISHAQETLLLTLGIRAVPGLSKI